jgi:aryl-alcohol dehydrogenase-like predicted oxidoreductase
LRQVEPAGSGPEHRSRAIAAFEAALEAGITFYDHADIYGGTACESIFKDCLAAVPGARERIFIATKFGIRRVTTTTRPKHIRDSIRGSLDRMGIDYVDLYQVHRPDPLADPRETAEVLDALVEEGLIRSSVCRTTIRSRRWPCAAISSAPIVSNQISISLLRLARSTKGTPARQAKVPATACSISARNWHHAARLQPARRRLAHGRKTPPADIRSAPRSSARSLRCARRGSRTTALRRRNSAIAWLLRHPARIIPIVGSNDPKHIHEAVGACEDRTLADRLVQALGRGARGRRARNLRCARRRNADDLVFSSHALHPHPHHRRWRCWRVAGVLAGGAERRQGVAIADLDVFGRYGSSELNGGGGAMHVRGADQHQAVARIPRAITSRTPSSSTSGSAGTCGCTTRNCGPRPARSCRSVRSFRALPVEELTAERGAKKFAVLDDVSDLAGRRSRRSMEDCRRTGCGRITSTTRKRGA